MTDTELAGRIKAFLGQAINAADGELSLQRQQAFDRYVGKPNGRERDGYSKYRTREVFEVVEWAKPALIRAFTGDNRVVSFQPVGPEDEELAAQETDLVNYRLIHSQGGRGFMEISDWITNALLYPNAYCKIYIEDDSEDKEHVAEGITQGDLVNLVSDPSVELRGIRPYTEPVMPPMDPMQPGPPQPIPMEFFDVSYTKRMPAQLRMECIPPEDIMIDGDLRDLDLDMARGICHRVQKTYTELCEMGYDKRKLDMLGDSSDGWDDDTEKANRQYTTEETTGWEAWEADSTMRLFWLNECYMWIDFEGTGKAQFRRIVLIGDQIFENEVSSYQPFVAMTAIKMPHRHIGLALSESTVGVQELSTTLHRNLLDNSYRVNNDRPIVSESAMLEDGTTLRALMNPQSKLIPVRGAARDALLPFPTAPFLQDILPVIQHIQSTLPTRSGVSTNMDVDTDLLQKSTEGAIDGAVQRAGARMELTARTMAETGFKKLYLKAHQLCRMYPNVPEAVQLRGKWVTSDPSGWQERTNVKVSVGPGLLDPEKKMPMLGQLLTLQKELAESDTGLVNPQVIYNTLRDLIDVSGIGPPEKYIINPAMGPDGQPVDPRYQPPEPAPDPNMVKAEAAMLTAQTDAERKNQELSLREDGNRQELEEKGRQFDVDATLRTHEAQLKDQEMGFKERELESRETELDAQQELTMADAYLKGIEAVKKQAEAEKILTEIGQTDVDIDKTDVEIDKTDAEIGKTLAETYKIEEEAKHVGDEPEGGDDGV